MYTLHCFLKLMKIVQRHDYTGKNIYFWYQNGFVKKRRNKNSLWSPSRVYFFFSTQSCCLDSDKVAEQHHGYLSFTCLLAVTAVVDKGRKRNSVCSFLIHRKIDLHNQRHSGKSRISCRKTNEKIVIRLGWIHEVKTADC